MDKILHLHKKLFSENPDKDTLLSENPQKEKAKVMNNCTFLVKKGDKLHKQRLLFGYISN